MPEIVLPYHDQILLHSPHAKEREEAAGTQTGGQASLGNILGTVYRDERGKGGLGRQTSNQGWW